MGNPRLNEAGDQRFLHYMRHFDNTAQVVDMEESGTRCPEILTFRFFDTFGS